MKAEHFTLIDQFVLDNLILRLRKDELNGKTRVTIGDAKGKRSEAINRGAKK